MGQASSRGASDLRPQRRTRSRPISWAPSSSPSPSAAAVEARPETSSLARPASQAFSPFNILPTHHEDPDAGPSEPAGTGAAALSRRRSRMSRARSSLSSLPSLLHRRLSSRSRDPETSQVSVTRSPFPPPRPARSPIRHTASAGNGRSHLPQLEIPDLDLDFDEMSGAAETGHPHTHLPRLIPTRRDGRSSLIPFRPDTTSRPFTPSRGLRSMTSSLRRRRSPLHRDEDQAAMLSQLLSAAAVATAASLMGDDHRAVSEARNVAGDGEDGTFDSFLQALQNGRIASALRQSGSGGEDTSDALGGSPVPLNFFRMFRFGSSTGNRRGDTGTGSRGSGPSGSGNQSGEEEESDGRMVPIIIVGIRSINPGTGSTHDDNIPPFLDALSSFPTPTASPGDSTIDGILRQPQQRFSHRRRASMGGLSSFPSNYDSQRHHRGPERPRPWSTFSDSPSGPLPPPSTPASGGLSAISSGTNTPALSTSPPSPTIQSSASSRRGSFVRRPTGSGLETTAEEPQEHRRIPRQRRMSESDFTRFGSGASRRNGVVEPDHNPGEGSRSWIIYVLGGSYPENHPILTTPSLFTDSPTYEDMLLLSSLLGPAKPPVASEESVASAGGLFTIRQGPEALVAQALEGADMITLASDARCLVCLCDFEAEDEARRLIKCGHLFHRICIDQWLTTGRNSCPLCRGQGVDEKTDSPQSTTEHVADDIQDTTT